MKMVIGIWGMSKDWEFVIVAVDLLRERENTAEVSRSGRPREW